MAQLDSPGQLWTPKPGQEFQKELHRKYHLLPLEAVSEEGNPQETEQGQVILDRGLWGWSVPRKEATTVWVVTWKP